ncbi:MAG: tetratricopeptide repeat protein [Desulfosarcina sp.]|nr:tetratricopeptide repeat protein [Desulfosarcina sp.]MBC2743383.1 tetratricopeptide repeat protein [Desulfosarcina sp.]MBC2766293.1 tetratricopeptide repeat protein [Desulfosarcina sp.]
MTRWRPKAILSLLFAMLLFSACVTTGVSPQDKKRASAARNLGEAYISEGNYTAALGELLKAEKLNADDPILHNDLGLVYMAKEKIDLAVVHFEKAVQLKPDYSLAKNNLGSAYMVQKEWDKAIPMLEDVTGDMLYATPHFPLANLGWAYYNKGKYNKAQDYLKEALKLQPDFFIAQLNLGRTYLATGRLHAALSLFEEAAKSYPKNPSLLLELGKTYRLLGDYNNAILALKGAIEYTEDSDLAVEASEELKKIYQ